MEFLALIGALVTGWLIYTSYKFAAFRGRVIGALVANGISEGLAKFIYASRTQEIHDLHFKFDVTPEFIAIQLAKDYSDSKES